MSAKPATKNPTKKSDKPAAKSPEKTAIKPEDVATPADPQTAPEPIEPTPEPVTETVEEAPVAPVPSEPETPAAEARELKRAHNLSPRCKRHLRAILIPHVRPDAVDANFERIVEHVEHGLCAAVLSSPPGVQMMDVLRADVSNEELQAQFGTRFRFEILSALRRAQVL